MYSLLKINLKRKTDMNIYFNFFCNVFNKVLQILDFDSKWKYFDLWHRYFALILVEIKNVETKKHIKKSLLVHYCSFH